jgi:hypothetical protein
VGGSSRGFVDQEKAIELRGHGKLSCLGYNWSAAKKRKGGR